MEQQVIEERTSGTREHNRAPRKRPNYWLVAIPLILLLIGAVIGTVIRLSERRALGKETETLAVPSVLVIHPKAEASSQDLTLPATLQAYTESPIYARTNGYLAKWYKDIGSHVRKGEPLAEIETPEIDQELVQARSARDQTAVQLGLAKTSAERWEALHHQDAVSQQETDERTSAYHQGQAALAAATANLQRLQKLESFKHISSPISGVVTKRNTDIGALINAGNAGPNQELFDIARIDPIRIYVDVPETYAPSIHPGVKANIELGELIRQRFTGAVVRTADAIDPATRTLHTEIDVPNPDGKLLPGSYAQVHFALNVQAPRLVLAVNALLFRAEGPRAAVVGSDEKIHLRPVVIGRDYGTEVEILSGVELNDSIVLNPSDALEEGQQVRVTSSQQGEQP